MLGRSENSDALKYCKTILQDFIDPQARGTLVMDIRRLESAEQNNDEEFGWPTDYEEGANKKNYRQHAKELPHVKVTFSCTRVALVRCQPQDNLGLLSP